MLRPNAARLNSSGYTESDIQGWTQHIPMHSARPYSNNEKICEPFGG